MVICLTHYVKYCLPGRTLECLETLLCHEESDENPLTLYDPGGGALKAPPLRFFALTHLILELHYCALVTFPKK